MRSLALSCGFGVLLALVGCGSDESGLFDITNSPPLAGSSGNAGTSAGGKGGKGGTSAGSGGSTAGKGGTKSETGGFAIDEGGAAGSDDVGGSAGDDQGGKGGAPGEGGSSGEGGAPTTGGVGGTKAGGTSAGTSAGTAGSDVGGAGGSVEQGGAGSGTSGQAGAGAAGQAGAATAGQAGSGTSGQSGAGQAGQGPAGSAGQAGAAGQAGGAGQGAGGAGAGGQSGAGGAGGGTTSPLDSCPGEAVTLVAGKTTLTGDTSTLKNDTNTGTNQCGGGQSNDAVYAMTASAAGRVTLVLTGSNFTPSVYVRKNCTDTGNVLCDAAQTSAQITFLVNKGTTFAAFVDGYGTSNQAGPYTLTATLEPSVCGNGNLEVGEQCDDGNTVAGDGCSDACQLEPNCKVNDGKDTTYTSPGVLPSGCATIDVSNVKITTENGASDNDWYCTEVAAGQTLTARTYTGAPGSCSVDPNNTFVEIYRNKPAQAPNNNTCQNNGAVACNDDIGQSNGFQATCSLASYKVPDGQGGLYCIRVTRGAIPEAGSTINYGLTITTQ